MTDSNHPITPSLELLKHWEEQHFDQGENYDVMLIQAYQAGADAELEACCDWFQEFYKTESWVDLDLKTFRAARRPKPPSLKELALEALTKIEDNKATYLDSSVIRRALKALPE